MGHNSTNFAGSLVAVVVALTLVVGAAILSGAGADYRLTATLPEACQLLGLGTTLGRSLARAGRFPTPVIHAGRRWLVPLGGLAKVLDMDSDALVLWLAEVRQAGS